MKKILFLSVISLITLLSTESFAVTNHIKFNGLNYVRAVNYDASPDTNPNDINYCRTKNPVSNQYIDIFYTVDPLTKNGFAKVISYSGQPIFHPTGLSEKIAFMSDGQYNQITRIILDMNNDMSNISTEWMTDPVGKHFQCIYSNN